MSATAPETSRAALHGVAVPEEHRPASLASDHILRATVVVEDMPIGDCGFAQAARMRVPFSMDFEVWGVDVRRLP